MVKGKVVCMHRVVEGRDLQGKSKKLNAPKGMK